MIGCQRWRPIWSVVVYVIVANTACGAGGQGGDHDNSDRLHDGERPGASGLVASLNDRAATSPA